MNRQNIVSVRFSGQEIKALDETAEYLERSRSDVIRLIIRQFYVENLAKKDAESRQNRLADPL